MGPVALLTVVVLAVFVGFEVVSKVTSKLHTPLMSGANAIHGIILVGAIIVAGQASDPWVLGIALLAVVLATVNLVGGFVVTDRMLEMFSAQADTHPPQPAPPRLAEPREKDTPARGAPPARRGRPMSLLSPEWTALLYLVAAVCFILALKGLSSPRTARRGNAIGAAGALLAVVTVFLSARLENVPLILAAIAVGSAIAVPVARRVQMTQMPQLVALFNGVGGGAAALVAVLELGHQRGSLGPPGRGLHHAGGRGVLCRLRGDCGQAAGAHQHPPAAVPRHALGDGGRPAGGGHLGGFVVADRVARLLLALLGLGLAAGLLLVLPVGGADVPIVISLLNAFTGLAVAASGVVLGNVLLLVAGTLVGRQRHHPDQGHGLGHGPRSRRHHVRGVQGRLDGGFHRAE